jgi:hypothetical protein
MFLEKLQIPRLKKDGTISQQLTVRYRFKCDHCGKIYEKRPCMTSVSKSGLTFCDNICKFESFKASGRLRERSRKTSLERYGTTIPMHNEIVKNKHKITLQNIYGIDVTNAMNIPGAKEKRKRTHLERYGFEETFQIEKFRQKRNETWKNNLPKNYISKPELSCLKLLQTQFGNNDVIHQKWVNGHPIDFYVKSIDTYIQFDGVYWHGLDRPLSVIRESQTARDQTIACKWLVDRQQDEWFAKHNLKLRRVTDKDNINVFIKSLIQQ